MRRSNRPLLAISILVLAISGTAFSFAQSRATRNGDGRGGDLYATQFKATTVNAYAARGHHDRAPSCTIPGVKEVNSIGVDRSGTLWLPQQNNDGGAQSILSFGPHCGAQGVTLHDPNGFPTAIAFDSKGTSYVMDAQTNPSGFGLIAVFMKGHTQPTSTLTSSAFHLLTAIGVDANDDVFVMTTAQGSRGQAVEFVKGKMPGKVVKGVTTMGIPGGALLFDRSGNLIIDDYSGGTLDVYGPPYVRAPKRTVLRGISWQCSLNRSESKLACADTGNGSVDVYAYPSLAYQYSITSGLAKVATVVGVAYEPEAQI